MANKHGGGKKPGRQRQRTPGPNKENKTPAMVPVRVTPRGEETKSEVKNKQTAPNSKDMGWWEWGTGLAEIPLVRFAGFLVASYLVWLGVTAQWGETDVARQQIEVSKQSMVLPNRPRFSLQPTPRPPLVAGQPIKIKVVMKNVGHSEALNVEPCWGHDVARLPAESFVAPPCPETERKKLAPAIQHVPVVPNNFVEMPFIITLTEGELRQMREKKAALYLYGEMHYGDFAKNTYPLSFCFFLTGEDDGSFSVCPKGNVNE